MQMNKKQVIFMYILWLFLIFSASAQNAPEQDAIISVERIWGRAQHNAFTSLIEYNNKLYCAFREGSAHVYGINGSIRVIASDDGQNWYSVAHLSEKDIVFMKEFKEMEKQNKYLKIVFTINEAKDTWKGSTGFIDLKMIKKEVYDYKETIFYLCGPPGMVKAMGGIMIKVGLPKDQIRIEKFTGYFKEIVYSVLDNPEKKISEIEMIEEEEIRRILKQIRNKRGKLEVNEEETTRDTVRHMEVIFNF